MLRHFMALMTLVMALALPAHIVSAEDQTTTDARAATGGAQTLDDILKRQEGLKLDDSFRSDNLGGDAGVVPALGTNGLRSDADVWRALRYNKADVRTSTRNETGATLVQDGGMAWYNFRQGPLATYGGWLLLFTIAALIAFYLLRGKIAIDEPMTGRTVTRFKFIERFSHWLLAGSFMLLGFTGLFVLFGRMFIAPWAGKEFNATLLSFSKIIHNNVAWAFILGLILTLVLWLRHNIPDRTDITWFKQYGGIIGKNHPPAKKFNGGQKIIFWSVILFGTSIAVSGVSLLFPFELPLMAKTFGLFNASGLPQMVGFENGLPVDLAPQVEMALTQAWHAIMAFILMAIIIAHIYIGSVGMDGAFDAMGSGEVDEAWAHQHHSIWLDEVRAEQAQSDDDTPPATPAE